MEVDKGGTGGLKKPRPDAENAEPVVQIPVDLPCLGIGRRIKNHVEWPNPVV